jgi:hypothetical protein
VTVRVLAPSGVDDARAKSIPEAVIEVFNAFIAANWNGNSATVKPCA